MEGRFLVKGSKVREFPRVAVIEKRMFTAENEMDCGLNSPTQ